MKVDQARINEHKDTIFPLHHLAAIILTAISVFILAPQLGKSTNLMSLKSSIGAFASEENVAAIEKSGSKVKYDSQYLIQLANLALRQGGLNEAKAIIAKINEIDKRSYYGKYFAAIVLENEGNFSQANSFRMQIEIIDPWNTKNMLQILRNHLALRDFSSATVTASKIHNLYPGIDEDLQAQELLSKYENS
jgi:tetratricopeptide (TPR) repeat protein